MSEKSTFTLTYRFRFSEGEEKVFAVELDKKSCALVQVPRETYPEWTKLGAGQCAHCPLNEADSPQCPVAVSIIDVVEFFYDAQSVTEAEVIVESEQRTTTRGVIPIFPAISSLIGIYMVSSGCPIMDKLRPMVRYHLPFSDMEETMYRALSMYVLAQYFRRTKRLQPDWELQDLSQIYQDINALNLDFSQRLRSDSTGEATTNAITSLDCFAQMIDFSITEQMLEDVEQLFQGYLKD